jgi:hypothetical protein
MELHEKLGTEYLFGNRVLGRIFGPKMEEGRVGGRKIHNDELHNLSFLPDVGECRLSEIIETEAFQLIRLSG